MRLFCRYGNVSGSESWRSSRLRDTGIISYVSTRNLAERSGFGPLSWLYPLCLDAVAAVGMDLWMSNSPAERPAAWLSLFAVGLSLAANVADWLRVGPGAAVSWGPYHR